MALSTLSTSWNAISSSLPPSKVTFCLPSRYRGGVPSRRGYSFCCLRNCSTIFLISRHYSSLWCLELCTRHRGPPSSLLDG
jgi:hypothetical protein